MQGKFQTVILSAFNCSCATINFYSISGKCNSQEFPEMSQMLVGSNRPYRLLLRQNSETIKEIL